MNNLVDDELYKYKLGYQYDDLTNRVSAVSLCDCLIL